MKPPRLGIALIVSGPSGAGKSTVCNMLREKHPELCFSVSCATRKPRKTEVEGKDYYFLTKNEFQQKIKNNEFLEYAEVHGNMYGTLKTEILERVRAGKDILLDIDVQGAFQIRESSKKYSLLAKCTEFIFLGPPSFEELERRLRSRASDSEEAIRKRLDDAKSELDHWRDYDYLIINKDVEETVKDMEKLIDMLHKSTKRLEDSGFYT
ncbi:MAG TPA: guanylate kinase [Lentisphaeria bacterium]|nr:MAG: guanylate kinase [Lentisphaerae bacterium GWF2_49_21]HBC87492.1 guanylate kinase [Lentisphaeria bacterium]